MLMQASQWSQSSHFTISVGNNLAVPGPGTSTQQPSRRWVSLEPYFLNYGLRRYRQLIRMLRNVSLFSVRGRV